MDFGALHEELSKPSNWHRATNDIGNHHTRFPEGTKKEGTLVCLSMNAPLNMADTPRLHVKAWLQQDVPRTFHYTTTFLEMSLACLVSRVLVSGARVPFYPEVHHIYLGRLSSTKDMLAKGTRPPGDSVAGGGAASPFHETASRAYRTSAMVMDAMVSPQALLGPEHHLAKERNLNKVHKSVLFLGHLDGFDCNAARLQFMAAYLGLYYALGIRHLDPVPHNLFLRPMTGPMAANVAITFGADEWVVLPALYKTTVGEQEVYFHAGLIDFSMAKAPAVPATLDPDGKQVSNTFYKITEKWMTNLAFKELGTLHVVISGGSIETLSKEPTGEEGAMLRRQRAVNVWRQLVEDAEVGFVSKDALPADCTRVDFSAVPWDACEVPSVADMSPAPTHTRGGVFRGEDAFLYERIMGLSS